MTRLSDEQLLRIERTEGTRAVAEAEVAPSTEVHVRDFGVKNSGPVGVITPSRKNTLFNRASGVGPDDVERIGEIVAFYAQHGVPPRIDVCPRFCTPALRHELERHGLEPGGFPFFSRRILIGVLAESSAHEPNNAAVGVSIRRVETSELDDFVAIQKSVWPTNDAEHTRNLAHARATHVLPNRYRYFASLDGSVVAIGAMDLQGDVAYLNLAATLEPHRGRGCQTALLQRRLTDARAAGAQLAFALVSPDSTSQRNIERAGLQVAYDREFWMPHNWYEHPFYRDAG